MSDNTERNMIRVLVGMTILVVGLFAINGCVVDATQPFPCDVCSHVVAGDGGVDAQ